MPPEEMSASDFLEHMAVDKKVQAGRIRLVLLRRLEATVDGDYPKGDIAGRTNGGLPGYPARDKGD